METSPNSAACSSQQQTFSWREPPVRTSPSRDSELAWMELVVTSPLNGLRLLSEHASAGWSGRMSPASCRLMKDAFSDSSSPDWQNSGMGSPTEFLTLNTSEFHSAAAASSLSDILETGVLQPQYYLSARACSGILRRADRRGKNLPEHLAVALESVAGATIPTEPRS